MYRVLRKGGTAVIQNMSREASHADINLEVQKMRLGWWSTFSTTATLEMLKRRAYSPARFQRLAVESRFHSCEITTEGIGLEVRLTKPAVSPMATPRRPCLALGAVAGPVLFTLGWFVLGFISPGYTMWGTRIAPYTAISQPLSGLGLGPTGPFMNAIFIVSGLLIVVGAFGVFRAIPELGPAGRWIGPVLFALPGLGSVTDGIFTLEHFFLHFVGFGLALTTVIGFAITGYLLRRVPGWRVIGSGLMWAGPLTPPPTPPSFAPFPP